MNLTTAVDRIKCGQIYVDSNDNFTVICKFCAKDCFALGLHGFVAHIIAHFPESPWYNIKEDSIKHEDSFNICGSESEAEEDVPRVQETNVEEDSGDIVQLGDFPTECESHFVEEPHPSTHDNILVEDRDVGNNQKHKVMNSKANNLNEEANANPSQYFRRTCNIKPQPRSLASAIHNDGIDVPKTPKRGFKCTFCSKIFPSKLTLTKHEHMHSGKRPHKCYICAKTFTTVGNLSSHTKSLHTQDRPYKCQVCPKRFVYKSRLNNHTRQHLPDSDPRKYFPCKICGDKFKSQPMLSYHNLRTHKKRVKFACDYCNKMLAQAGYKRYHEKKCVSNS